VPGPLDGGCQFALVSHAITGDAPRNYPTPLSQKILQQAHILEIDRPFVDTKSTRPAALEKPSASFPISALFTLHTRFPFS
jgi:hypothetical protein